MRVDRLAALARVWGAANYFHPALASRGVWWEDSLRLAYEKADDTDADSCRNAAEWLLRRLDDPATGLVPGPEDDAPREPGDGSEPVRDLGDGILLLSVAAFRRHPSGPEMYVRFDHALRELTGARGLVLDLRRPGRLFEFGLLRSLVGALIGAELTLPSVRRRYHSGLPSEATETVVASESGLIVTDPSTVPAQGANPFLSAVSLEGTPAALIVSDANEPGYPHALALRSIGRAHLLHAASALSSAPGQELELFDGLWARVRTAEFVPTTAPDLVSGDAVARARELLARGTAPEPRVPAAPLSGSAAAAPSSRSARPIVTPAAAPLYPTPTPTAPFAPAGSGAHAAPPPLPAPSRPERLAAAAKLWCAANWFFAHQDLCDEPWERALAAALPRFGQAEDGLGYALAVNDLARRLCDTHAVTKSRALMASRGGPASLPALVRLVEGRTVVIAAEEGAAELRVGDVVVSVDGEKTEERRERLGRLLSHSSRAGEDTVVDGMLLTGSFGQPAELRVESADGTVRVVHAVRGQALHSQYRFGHADCEVLDGGIGYLDLTAIALDRVDACFDRLSGCRGIVFDLRGTPGSGVRRAAARLTGAPRTYGFDCYPTPTLAGPSIRREELVIEPATAGVGYGGRVAVLIDERTVSHGEVTLLMLLGAADGVATTFGERTSGVVGHPTEIQLPGHVRVCFSAVDVRDRRDARIQRTGIAPDVEVVATLAGIRAGRDEVIEVAATRLREG